MDDLHVQSRRALILVALGACVVLAACNPASAPPVAVVATADLPPTGATVAAYVPPESRPSPPIATLPPPATAQLAVIEPETPTAIVGPVSPVALASTLPTDQPWLLAGSRLFAIDRSGRKTELDRSISALIKRPGAPPLLATHDDNDIPLIVDPSDWSEIRLDLKPGSFVAQGAASPDGKQAVLQILCTEVSPCASGALPWIQIADLHTGALHQFGFFPVAPPVPSGPYTENANAFFQGWGAAGLYFFTDHGKARSELSLIDPTDPTATSRVLVNGPIYALNSDKDILVTLLSSYNPDPLSSVISQSLVLSDFHRGINETIDHGAWISNPAIAPDGTAVAYLRSDEEENGPVNVELVLFDVVRSTKTVLNAAFGLSLYLRWAPSTFWSQDSQRIIAVRQTLQSGAEVVLLTRDGTEINAVPLPDGEMLGTTDDDQLVLSQSDGRIVNWLPLRPAATAYAPAVTTFGDLFSAIAMPPLGSNALPPLAPTSAAPPLVTQLPTPAVPTPLQSKPLPITTLGDIPSDAQVISDLPIDRHILYSVNGALYSQPLSGGSAIALGGDQSHWNGPLFISSDGNTLLEQRTDGIYRAPIAGGPAVKLSQPPATGDGSTISYAGISPDGRLVLEALAGEPPAAWKDQLQDPRWTLALFVVPFSGGTPVRLSGSLDPDNTIAYVQITADGQRVIYAVAAPDPNSQLGGDGKIGTAIIRLYSVPLAGGTPTQLASGSLSDAIRSWQLTPDSQYVLYQKGLRNDLFSVPVAGGSSVQLSAIHQQEEQIYEQWISPDSRYVLYVTASALYAASIADGHAVNLVGTLPLTEGLVAEQITPDSRYVLFRTNSALYRVPITGGPPTRLTTLTSSTLISDDELFIVGENAMYMADNAIYRVPLAGGTATRLTGPPDPDGVLQLPTLSPDSRYLVYTIDRGAERNRALYSVPIGGGAPVLLFAGPDNTTGFYQCNGDYALGVAGNILYAAPLAGGQRLRLSETPQTIGWTVIRVDDNRVIYTPANAGNAPRNLKSLMLATLPPVGR